MPDAIQGLDTTGSFGTLLRTRYAVAQTAPAIPSQPGSGVDSADVARTLALLKTIAETAGSVPAVDEARVAALQ